MVLDKSGLPAWSAATFEPGRRRAKDTVVAVSCLVLDYDEGTPIAEVHEAWSPWPHVLHTSWSHTEAHAKSRVVLPFEVPIAAVSWPRVFAWALTRAPSIDRRCSDPSRLWFVPAIRSAEWPFVSKVWDEPSNLLRLEPENLPPAPAEHPPKLTLVRRESGPPPRVRADRQLGEAQRALKASPDARRRAGEALGGRVCGGGDGERIDQVVCPACGRLSVWWPVSPRTTVKALCHHRASCGWTGFLDTLLDAAMP